MNTTPCHKDELKKLNRITGQIEGVKKMIEDCRYCPDILTQLRAIRSAVRGVEARVLEKHLQSCVRDAMESGDHKKAGEKIDELVKLFKRYDGN